MGGGRGRVAGSNQALEYMRRRQQMRPPGSPEPMRRPLAGGGSPLLYPSGGTPDGLPATMPATSDALRTISATEDVIANACVPIRMLPLV